MGTTNVTNYDSSGHVLSTSTVPTTPQADNADAINTWLDNLITTGDNAVTNWGGLSAAQKDAAAKQCVQAVIRLARLVRNNLSSPGA